MKSPTCAKTSTSSSSSSSSLVTLCLDMLKREDIKTELRTICSPLCTLIYNCLTPYIYIFFAFVFFTIAMLVLNFFLLLWLLKHTFWKGGDDDDGDDKLQHEYFIASAACSGKKKVKVC